MIIFTRIRRERYTFFEIDLLWQCSSLHTLLEYALNTHSFSARNSKYLLFHHKEPLTMWTIRLCILCIYVHFYNIGHLCSLMNRFVLRATCESLNFFLLLLLILMCQKDNILSFQGLEVIYQAFLKR